MYSFRRVYNRTDPSWTSRITKARAYVVSAFDARVGQNWVTICRLDRFLLSRLYPGVASPSGPVIGSGWKPTAIQKPGDTEISQEDDTSNTPNYKPVTASLAPRVVGSFDHPMLPMPPVS